MSDLVFMMRLGYDVIFSDSRGDLRINGMAVECQHGIGKDTKHDFL